MGRDHEPRDVDPDFISILLIPSITVLLETGCIAWDDLNSDDKEILSIFQYIKVLLEGTVQAYNS